jgi:Flp pilus assembly protein TadD
MFLSRFPLYSIVATVFLVPVVWVPWLSEQIEFPRQYALVFLVALGVLALVVRMVFQERKITIWYSLLDVFVGAVVGSAVLSTVFSLDLAASLVGDYGRFVDSIFSVLAFGGLYFLITQHKEKVPVFITVVLFSLTLSLLLGTLSLLGKVSFEISSQVLAVQAGVTAVFLVATLSLQKRITAFVSWGALFLSLFVLILVDSSIAWITVGVGLLVLLLFELRSIQKGQSKTSVTVLVCAGVLLLGFVAWISPPFVQAVAQEPLLSQGDSWQIAQKTITQSPKNAVIGSGLGTVGINAALHKPAELASGPLWQVRFDTMSFIPELLATRGLVGFVSFLALWCMFFLFTGLRFWHIKDRTGHVFFAVMASLLVAQFGYYQTTLFSMLFWVFLALSVSQGQLKEWVLKLHKFREVEFVGKGFVVLLGIGFVLLAVQGVKLYKADVLFAKAQRIQSSTKQIQYIEEAVSIYSFEPEYRTKLSRAYGAYAKAELQKPKELQDQESIAQAIQRAIAYAKGTESIQGAVQGAPFRVFAWESLGMLYRDIQLAPGAVEWGIRSFENAVKLEPTNPALYVELGKLYTINNEPRKAQTAFETALMLRPSFWQASVQRALLFEKEGDRSQAIRILKELAYSSNETDILFQLGRLLVNDQQFTQGIIYLEKVIQGAPSNSNAYFTLGLAYERIGKTEQARTVFEKVLQLNPNNQDVQKRLEAL